LIAPARVPARGGRGAVRGGARGGAARPSRPGWTRGSRGFRGRLGSVAAVAPVRQPVPTLRLERRCWEAGDRVVVGIDEVGRGAWAGPVTVGAVVSAPEHLKGIRDSKMLTRHEREQAAGSVREWAVAIGVGHASYEEGDE